MRLAVSTALAPEIGEGDSVAVNGVCLTATAIADGRFSADVMRETLRRSSLAEVGRGRRGQPRAAAARGGPARRPRRAGPRRRRRHDRASVREDGFSRIVEIAAPAETLRYVVEKGSIAVDGISLTVAVCDG